MSLSIYLVCNKTKWKKELFQMSFGLVLCTVFAEFFLNIRRMANEMLKLTQWFYCK